MRVNPLDPNARKLYKVIFDKENNPLEAKLAPLNSQGGHGLSSWDQKTFFTKWVYVEALNVEEAIQQAKEIATRRIEKL